MAERLKPAILTIMMVDGGYGKQIMADYGGKSAMAESQKTTLRFCQIFDNTDLEYTTRKY